MKRLLFLFVCFFSLLIPRAQAADTDWSISSFHSNIALQDDGSLLIQEQIQANFKDIPKHGIYRDIPTRYVSQKSTRLVKIDQISATLDGIPTKIGISNLSSGKEIKIGDPDKTITGSHQIDLRYRVKGALSSYAEYDELYWNVTGNAWPVPISYASATVTLPTGVKPIESTCYSGVVGSHQLCTQKSVLEYNQALLSISEGITVVTTFPKGSVPVVEYTLTGYYLQIVGSFLLILLVGLTTLILHWRAKGRDLRARGKKEEILPLFEREVVAVEYAVPGNLRPAELALLESETVQPNMITATIVDLAVQGYLQIEELDKKWPLAKPVYALNKKKDIDNNLKPYEKQLLEGLFAVGKERVLSSELKGGFYKTYDSIKKNLYADTAAKGFFVEQPDKVRMRYTVGAILIDVLGAGLTAVGFIISNPLVAGVGAGLFVVGIFGFLFALLMPKRTAEGHTLLQKIKGYRLFLSSTEKYRQPFFEDQNLFMQVLPYAIVFGVTHKLAKAMEHMGIAPAEPNWYHGNSAFQVGSFMGAMTHFDSNFSKTIAPVSTSGGSGMSGGFSGGGFGGGGGGSW